MIDTILFDLDGTLLPMDAEAFVKIYFGALARRFAQRGFDPEPFVKNIWRGTRAMVQNDGSMTNRERFFLTFESLYGPDARRWEAEFLDFYACEFEHARAATHTEPLAGELVARMKRRGFSVILATNPLFPEVATRARCRWAGLDYDAFDLVTTYERARYAKPNLKYYEETVAQAGRSVRNCLMVGNDVSEDLCARQLGMAVFLLEGHVLNPAGADLSGYRRGGFEALGDYLDKLSPVLQ